MLRRAMMAAESSGGLWTPANLSTPAKFWLDWDSDVTESGPGFAGVWANRGSTSGTFSTSASGTQPAILAAELNGKRVLRFDGVDDYLRNGSGAGTAVFSSVSVGWCFAVARRRTTIAKWTAILQSRVSTTNGAGRFACYNGNNVASENKASLFARRNSGDSAGSVVGSIDLGTDWALLLFEQNWGTGIGRLVVNGQADGAATTTTLGATPSTPTDYVYLGSEGTTTFNDSDIACVLAGAGTLPSADEYQRIEGWAAWQCGLEGNLPVGHPYKDAPPTT